MALCVSLALPSEVATGWGRTELELPQRPTSKEVSTRLAACVKAPFLGLVFIWSDSEHALCKGPAHWAFVENGQLQLFNHSCLRWFCCLGPTVADQKKTERKIREWNVHQEPCKAPPFFWESTRLCRCPGKTGEGPQFSPLADLEVLRKQKVRLR